MSGLVWEEFVVGRQWRSGDRLLTVVDLERFSELSGDLNPLHLDDAAARAAGYEGRIAQGVLGAAVATGLVNRLGVTAGTLVGLLEIGWRFERPVYPEMRVHVELTVAATRPTRRPDRGIVEFEALLVDEAGAACQRGRLTMLVRRRAA